MVEEVSVAGEAAGGEWWGGGEVGDEMGPVL